MEVRIEAQYVYLCDSVANVSTRGLRRQPVTHMDSVPDGADGRIYLSFRGGYSDWYFSDEFLDVSIGNSELTMRMLACG